MIAGPSTGSSDHTMGEAPLALLPVVGRPVVHHLADHLLRAGIEEITVLSETAPAKYLRAAQRPGIHWMNASNGSLWGTAEAVFNQFAQGGAELVLVIRLGAYAEVDIKRLVQFHLEQRNRVTAVEDSSVPLDVFLISASRRNDAAYMFRRQLTGFRTAQGRFRLNGYANRLADGGDLRRLAADALALKTRMVPAGRQIKPGVWVEDGARVHRGARILAPAFVGAHSKIRAGVVLTRGAVVEHHAEIDCGTVVENTSVLPYTYIGAGLDLSHAVAGFHRLVNLRRNVTLEITDPKLVGEAPASAPLRTLVAAASLAIFLPRQFLRGLFAPSQREPLTALPAAVHSPPVTLQGLAAEMESAATEGAPSRSASCKVHPRPEPTDSAQFPADFFVVRRYGDQ